MSIWDIICARTRSDEAHYRIRGVVEHRGGVSGGHYVAYRHWRDHWYMVNDDQVEQVEFSNDICPYILIYERKQFV